MTDRERHKGDRVVRHEDDFVLKDVYTHKFYCRTSTTSWEWVDDLGRATFYTGRTPPPPSHFPFPMSTWDSLRWASAIDGSVDEPLPRTYPREPEVGEWYTDMREGPSNVCVYVRRRAVADEKLAQFPGTERASLQGLVDRHNQLVKTMRDVASLVRESLVRV